MKKDTELDNLLEEYHNLMDPQEKDFNVVRENAMFLSMSEKYGKIPEDREVIIRALKNGIEELKEKKQIAQALDIVEGFKRGDIKIYPIDTLWKEL